MLLKFFRKNKSGICSVCRQHKEIYHKVALGKKVLAQYCYHCFE